MCILADLSLRRSGFGDWINHFLQEALKQVRALCTDELERQFRANSAPLFAAIQDSLEEMTRVFRGLFSKGTILVAFDLPLPGILPRRA